MLHRSTCVSVPPQRYSPGDVNFLASQMRSFSSEEILIALYLNYEAVQVNQMLCQIWCFLECLQGWRIY